MLRGRVGRLLIVAAGGGCLALLIFVVLPTMNVPAPPMPQDEIAAEVFGIDEQSADEGEPEAVMPVPSPLVGVSNDGEEVAVIFPAAEPGAEELQAAAEADPGDERGLPQALSAADVAEARAALAGREPEPVVAVEPNAATGIEEEAAVAVAPPVAETAGAVEAERAELDSTAGSEDGAPLSALPARQAEAVEAETEPVAVAAAPPVERVSVSGDGRPGNVQRLEVRRGEFDRPVWSDSRARREVSHPSGGLPAAAGAAQAGNAPSGLPPRTARAGVVVPGTLRGVMGYRLPLVSRQEVPDQIVSGVLIPAHTTFVIVQPGTWKLVDLTAEEVQALREAAARQEPEAAAQAEAAEVETPWTLWRALRGRRAPARD